MDSNNALLSIIIQIAEKHFGDELEAYSTDLFDVGAAAFRHVLITCKNGDDVIGVMSRSREAALLAMIDAAPDYVLEHRQ